VGVARSREQEKAIFANLHKAQYVRPAKVITKKRDYPSVQEALGKMLYERRAKKWAKSSGVIASQARAVKILDRTTGRGKRRQRVPLVGKAEINAVERWLGNPNPIKLNRLIMDERTRTAVSKYKRKWHLFPIRPRKQLSVSEQYTLDRFGKSLLAQQKARKKVAGALSNIVKRRKGSGTDT
jgi:hypothetical protein